QELSRCAEQHGLSGRADVDGTARPSGNETLPVETGIKMGLVLRIQPGFPRSSFRRLVAEPHSETSTRAKWFENPRSVVRRVPQSAQLWGEKAFADQHFPKEKRVPRLEQDLRAVAEQFPGLR